MALRNRTAFSRQSSGRSTIELRAKKRAGMCAPALLRYGHPRPARTRGAWLDGTSHPGFGGDDGSRTRTNQIDNLGPGHWATSPYSGADNGNRIGRSAYNAHGLILTKDALYHLSYIGNAVYDIRVPASRAHLSRIGSAKAWALRRRSFIACKTCWYSCSCRDSCSLSWAMGTSCDVYGASPRSRTGLSCSSGRRLPTSARDTFGTRRGTRTPTPCGTGS